MNIFHEVGETFLVWIKIGYLVAIAGGVILVIAIVIIVACLFLFKNGKSRIGDAITSLIK